MTLILYTTRLYFVAQVQDFRRNVLDVCESSVKQRTSSDRSMVLYNYPPNLVLRSGGLDEVELIEADISFYSSDGKQLKTTLKVRGREFAACQLHTYVHMQCMCRYKR